MTFEFANKIQQLTNKLQHIKEHQLKDTRIDDAKQQLRTLQNNINKELSIAEKRIRKIQTKLEKKAQSARGQKQSVQNIWEAKEDKVSDIIGCWVNQYQQKTQNALEDINRQEQLLKAKIQQEQSLYDREAKILQNRINGQFKVLEKQISKWNSINAQNQTMLMKQMTTNRQNLIKQISEVTDTKQRQIKSIKTQLSDLKERTGTKIQQIRTQTQSKSLKTKQIINLLLQIQ